MAKAEGWKWRHQNAHYEKLGPGENIRSYLCYVLCVYKSIHIYTRHPIIPKMVCARIDMRPATVTEKTNKKSHKIQQEEMTEGGITLPETNMKWK